jgi:5-methylcytosine-specific restriction endonuclease McrA
MADYRAYLRSDHWLDIRRRVLQRAQGLCEGCLRRRATQVHHLTYAHAGAEFLWELVAVCEQCHARVHGK